MSPQDTHKPTDDVRTGWLRGLSGKVLAMTILFVMIGEVLIFLPSIANFRVTWLKSRIAQAEIAALAVEAAQNQNLSNELRDELLRGAGVKVVALKKGSTRHLVLRAEGDLMIKEAFDLRKPLGFDSVAEALVTLVSGGDRIIGVIDEPPNMSGDFIELALEESHLRNAMVTYSFNILQLSIILSLIVAILVFLVINHVLVRPVRRMTENMLAFAKNPEDAERIARPSGRRDEIGVAEKQLEHMQRELSDMLQQKNRLAALGLAVSKVSHDLRNMLSSAQLISDRLGMVNDPTVQKFTPKLISSLDRAIDFCAQTLKFGKAQEAPPRRENFTLRPVIEEVIDTAVVQASSRIIIYNDAKADVQIDADREHVFRVVMNLLRNAIDVLETATASGQIEGEGRVRIAAWREGATTTLEVRDNGPGVPEKARAHLFEAFRSSVRSGGTGLGLAISNELVRAHGGEIRLLSETGSGAVFRVTIPDRVVELQPGKRGHRESTSQKIPR